jgi:hypothetical protein
MSSGPVLPMIEHLAKAGFALHWLHPKSKRPIGTDWANKPVASLSDLKRTYRDGNNVGVRLGKWSVVGGLFLHIIDFDIRKPEMVEEARETLLALMPRLDLNVCPTVISGSGGESRHFYILTDQAFPSKKFAHSEGFELVWDESKQRDVKKWDWELHLLATGSQAAIPPSIHPDTNQPYRWIREFDFDMLELGIGPIYDSFEVAAIASDREDNESNAERQQPLGLSEDEIRSILADLPFDEWCEDRDGWYRVGMAVRHECSGSDAGFRLWCDWSKQSSKFEINDALTVWKSFKEKTSTPFRMASLVAVVREVRAERQLKSIDDDFDEVEEDDSDDMFDDLLGDGPAPKKISRKQIALKKEEVEFGLGRGAPKNFAKLNEKHAVARVSGRTVILDFEQDGSVTYGNVGDLHNLYENERVPKDGTTEPVSKAWMRSKWRRTYPHGIIFAPNRNVEGTFNHWRGWSVEPNEDATCARFIEHLHHVICDGDDDYFEYALNYFAHIVQKPEEKPGVAFVVKGKKGAGKDSVIEYFAKLIVHHYIAVASKDQMVGKFNMHQARLLVLGVQEGYWAGDKRDEGMLKYLITSENAMIEPKGMNAFPIKSVLRIFISSNEKWVVPATEDERRFFVLNVSNNRVGDHKYFADLRAEMNGEGPAALLDLLQKRDISNFQVRKVPNTQGLAEQKVEGLKNVEAWWVEVLEQGSIVGCDTSQWLNCSLRIGKHELRAGYSLWLSKKKFHGDEASEIGLGKRLKVLVPELRTYRSRAGSSVHSYILPDLTSCRQAFEETLGSELRWPDVENESVEDDDFDDLDIPTNPSHTLTI